MGGVGGLTVPPPPFDGGGEDGGDGEDGCDDATDTLGVGELGAATLAARGLMLGATETEATGEARLTLFAPPHLMAVFFRLLYPQIVGASA